MTYTDLSTHLRSMGYSIHHTAKHPCYYAKDAVTCEHYEGRYGTGILVRKSAGIRCTYHIAEYWMKEGEDNG